VDVFFTEQAAEELDFWRKKNPKLAERIAELVRAIKLDPYEGIGKPEPLKYALAGLWSRRINREHRLVYQIKDGNLIVIQCRYHY